ncbi:HupE / UreJ protein [Pustulibacterium marinum]|uniref:HupE / UreJ protein n=1 Tax=Pustulibacterium marinum TaxID=1224947 RepID=A0A1I7ESU5_9FLAO|nr:HupE/UreJ family protein [Pustulibacterium marinum]SFU26992.1 HupE / UreJ protein [Pustulibacterium marinum]
MDQFWFYTQLGLGHVLDINAYDHILFFAALVVPYLFRDWSRVLWLVTIFTIGHTASLLFAVYGMVNVEASYVEFLIPVTIFITAFYNVFTAGKSNEEKKINLVFLTSLGFGLIHGLGFSNYFKQIVAEQDGKLWKSLEFALGVEIAQVIVVFIVLFLGVVLQNIFRLKRRDWILVLSSIIIGIVIPMLADTYPFG